MLYSLLRCGYTTTEIETACMNVRTDTQSSWRSEIEKPTDRSKGMVDDRFSSAATTNSATQQPLTAPCRIASPSAPSSMSSLTSKSPPRRTVYLSNAPLPCITTSPPSPCMRKQLSVSPPPPPPLMRVGSPSLSPSSGGKCLSPIPGHASCCERRQ
jgi:hypothetical protein